MKCKTLLLALLAFLTLSLPTASFAFDSDFDAFEQKFFQTKSIKADFTQVYYNALEERKKEFKGVFYLKKPGLMRWEYTSPEPMQMIVGKKKIFIVDPILENVTIQSLDQVTQLESLNFFFQDTSFLKSYTRKKRSKSYLSSGSNLKKYFLAPKNPTNHLVELQIAINTRNKTLQEFVIIDSQNNYRKISLKALQLNLKLKPALFGYIIPENMEVIDTMTP